MRSKKLAVWFGLFTVLLMSLSAAAAPDLVRISQGTTGSDVAGLSSFRRVKPVEFTPIPTWRGAVVVFMSCRTPGATIKYTWNGSSERTYQNPLYVTRDAVIKAWATKIGWQSSFWRYLIIDFWPYNLLR